MAAVISLQRSAHLLFGALCLLAFLLVGCNRHENSDTAPILQGLASDEAFGPAWTTLIEDAQAEGELVLVLGSFRTRSYRLFLEAFSNKFGIGIVTTPGGSGSVAQRLLAERRQGRFTSDVVMISPGSIDRLARAQALARLEPLLIHPEVQDRSTGWLDVGSIWLGQKPGYVAATALRPRANLAEIYYNLNQVDPEELEGIRSWHNFLKPEWRGRIVCVLDPNSTTAGSDWRSAWVVLGNPWFERFMRELAPVLLPDSSHHELVHGVAKGKYDIALFASRAASLQFQKLARAGIPVRKLTRTLEEGNWASLSGAIGIFDNAPNPHAAQLFVNWYMSREGQTTLVNLILADDPYPSLRTDVPQGRVADYAWNIALNIDRSSIVRSDPEWDETTFEESSAVMKSLCARFGCYGY